MQCLIIAAGQGSRLRSRAASKPLARIAGRPLIEHVVRRAQAGGASRFVVVTGYAAEGIEAFLAGLAAAESLSIECVRNEEWRQPNGHSVLAAAPALDDRFLLVMADHLVDSRIVAAAVAAPRNGALLLAVDRDIGNTLIDLDDATKVKTGADSRIVRLGKSLADYDAIDTGVFRSGQALIEALRESIAGGGQGSLSEGVQGLADRGLAFALDVSGHWWLDVDDPRALEIAQAELGAANKLI
jgi:1L-myo-inositol 1-phosphate cytidylyltransferase